MAARSPKPAPKTSPRTPIAPKGKTKAVPQAKAKPAPKAKVAPKAKANTKPAPKAKANAKPAPKAKANAKAAPKPKRGAPLVARKKLAAKPSPAREALKAFAMKKVIAEVIEPAVSGSALVDAYLRDIDHPFKAEIAAVRAIILGASNKISERIKWNAPSFFYKEDLGAFNPRASEYAHLILLFPGGLGMPDKSKLLEGKQKDRREAKFYSLSDVESKKPALEKLVKSWIKLRDAEQV